jgi:hypothetical protein
MKQIFFSMAFLSLVACANAQTTAAASASASTTNPKMDAIITALEGTEFIKQYKEYQVETEAVVNELKNKADVPPAELAKLKFAYKQSKTKFDELMNLLKRDLANPSTRKMIRKSPDLYTSSYQLKLDAAKTYCQNNFHAPATKVLQHSGGTEQIELVIKTLFDIFKLFTDSSSVNEAANAAYLDTQFIQPLRYKSWEKIE